MYLQCQWKLLVYTNSCPVESVGRIFADDSLTRCAHMGSASYRYSEFCGVKFAEHSLTAVARFGGQDPNSFIPDDSETEGASGLVT